MRRAEGGEGDFREPISAGVDGRWPGGDRAIRLVW